MLHIQTASQAEQLVCAQCGGSFERIYGALYEDGDGVGIYSADLHARAHDARMLLAIGLLYPDAATGARKKFGITLEVWPTDTEYHVMIREAAASPYLSSGLMGTILDRAAALASPHRDGFFKAADVIIDQETRIRAHLSSV